MFRYSYLSQDFIWAQSNYLLCLPLKNNNDNVYPCALEFSQRNHLGIFRPGLDEQSHFAQSRISNSIASEGCLALLWQLDLIYPQKIRENKMPPTSPLGMIVAFLFFVKLKSHLWDSIPGEILSHPMLSLSANFFKFLSMRCVLISEFSEKRINQTNYNRNNYPCCFRSSSSTLKPINTK